MPIFGLNFNGTQIPEGYQRRFARRVKALSCGHAVASGAKLGEWGRCEICNEKVKVEWFVLQGVCSSPEEKNAMLIQANNGHRKLHVETRKTAGHEFYGIYSA